jgi:hypothetical protein
MDQPENHGPPRPDKDSIDLREQLVRIDDILAENARWRAENEVSLAKIDRWRTENEKMIAETRAIKQHTIPPWLFIVCIVLAMVLLSPVTIAVLDRVWPK